MTGWGSGPWGETPWGVGAPAAPLTPAVITPLDPLAGAVGVPLGSTVNIQFSDELEVLGDSITVAVNGVYYVVGGQAVNQAEYSSTANSYNGFDTTTKLPFSFSTGATQEVFVTCMDSSGFLSTLTYYFTTGIGLRLLSVRNPREGMLLVHFNRPMRRNNEFHFTGNWQVTPLDGGSPVVITRASGNPRSPHGAHLLYTGGSDGLYRLTVISLTSEDGDTIERGYESIDFTLLYGEEEVPTVRLFDTIFGPIGISQGLKTRRSIDSHTASKATAIGINTQISQRREALDDTAGRDGRPGARRTA